MTRALGRATPTEERSYWTCLSDEELLKKTFTTTDPEGLPGLIHELPPQSPLPIIEFLYDFRGTDHTKLRCMHCNRPIHLAGYVLNSDDGRRFLVGHKCGGKIYGTDFNGILHDFEGARTRASLIKRMRNLYLGLPAFNAYLLAVRTHPTIAAYQHLRAKFKKETPRLWGALVMACFHDQGHLIIQHEIPDPDAEKLAETKYLRDLEEWRAMSHAQRKKFRRPQPPIKPIFKTIAENAGQLPGTTFFSDKPFSKKELDEIALQFRHLVDDLNIDERALSVYRDRAKYDSSERKTRGSLSATTAYMKQVLWQASVLLGRLEENFVKLAEPVRLFRVSQLSTICRWANSKLDNEYAVAGKSIQERDTYGKISTIGLPSEYTIPSMEGLEVFGRIINSND